MFSGHRNAHARGVESRFPDWLEFHTVRFGGPVGNVRSRSGVVRVEAGQGETIERKAVGIPDDEAWADLARTLEEAGFWDWSGSTEHSEPHRPDDWYWWLDVHWDERRHLAAGWREAPDGFDRVSDALYELVEQVIK